jgi:LysM repeat protein
MTNFQGRLSRESRGYVKTALTKGIETGVRKWSSSRGAGWLVGRTLGKAVSGPIGVGLEVFWPSNTIVSGAEEMRMLREARMHILQTSPPWEKLPQSILRPIQPTITGTGSGIHPSLIDRRSAVKVTPREIGIVHPYTVKANDRIWNLAPDYGYHNRRQFTQDVLKANPGLDPRRLRVGQIINLPLKTQLGGGIQSGASAGALAGVSGGIHPALTDYQGLLSHTVRKGENLTQIAQRYGTSVNALYDANRNIIGSNKNLIRPGQQFVIPQH